MPITVRPVSAIDVADFVTWKYEPPYDDYNLNVPLEEALKTFLDPATQCHAILEGDGLFGYCTFGEDGQVPGGDYTTVALDIGAAIKPEMTGRGRGASYVADIIDFAIRKFDPTALRVSIAAHNERAIKVWVANGFTETQRFSGPREILGTTEFAIFERILGG